MGQCQKTMTGTSRLCPDQGDLPRGWTCVFICLGQSCTKWYTQGALRKPLPGTGSDSGAGASSVPPMDLSHQGTRRGWLIRKLLTIVCGPRQYGTYLPATTDVFMIILTCSAR